MEPIYKCIWMAAGVLSYRLCDREFDCDRCLVDRALREGSSPSMKETVIEPARLASTAAAPSISGLRFSRASFYHPSHLWVRVEEGGTVRIGIDDLARRLLGRVDEIGVPPLDATLRLEQKALSFRGDAGDIDLPTPISGTILARNEELLADPGKLQRTPHHEVWLVRARPHRLQEDLSGLFYGHRVVNWLRAELDKVRDRLLASQAVEVGSLPDGGSLDAATLDQIDPRLRRFLVEDLLLGPTQDQKGR
jgi:glycine cleavage system H lipoate-binding protein